MIRRQRIATEYEIIDESDNNKHLAINVTVNHDTDTLTIRPANGHSSFEFTKSKPEQVNRIAAMLQRAAIIPREGEDRELGSE